MVSVAILTELVKCVLFLLLILYNFTSDWLSVVRRIVRFLCKIYVTGCSEVYFAALRINLKYVAQMNCYYHPVGQKALF